MREAKVAMWVSEALSARRIARMAAALHGVGIGSRRREGVKLNGSRGSNERCYWTVTVVVGETALSHLK